MSDFATRLTPEIPSLRRYARALTRDASAADDLVQSCLLRALAKQHLWHTDSSLRCWLFTMLHNLYVSQVRRSVREQRCLMAMTELAVQCNGPRLVNDVVDLERAIAKLPNWQRQVLVLVGLKESSYSEAAAALALPVGTVRSRLGRARASVRQLISGDATKSGTGGGPLALPALVAQADTIDRGTVLRTA